MKDLDIGTWVEIKAKKIRDINKFKVSWVDKFYKKPVIGKVVGKARRFSGVRKSCGYGGTLYEPPEYTNYLEVQESYIFYRVCLGWFNLPVLVSEENIKILPTNEIPNNLPELFTDQPEWPKDTKDFLRKEMSNWPRDSKGRWIK